MEVISKLKEVLDGSLEVSEDLYQSARVLGTKFHRELRDTILVCIGIFLLSAVAMWVININDLQFWNITIIITGILSIAMLGAKIKVVLGTGLIGFVISYLSDKDFKKAVLESAPKGFGVLIDTLVAVGFVWTASGFVFTVITFVNHPGSVWALCATALVMIAGHLKGGEIRKNTKWVVIFALCVILPGPVWDSAKLFLGLEYNVSAKSQVHHRSPTQPARTQPTVTKAPEPVAVKSACGRELSSLKKCQKWTLRNGGTFTYRALGRHRYVTDSKSLLNIVPIGDGYTFKVSSKYHSTETIVHFGSLAPGQKMFGQAF